MSTLDLNQLVRDAHEQNNYDSLISLMPYAKLLGIECLRLGDDMVFRLPANQDCIGNPTLPALHGGVIAGFMEHCAKGIRGECYFPLTDKLKAAKMPFCFRGSP